MQEIKITTPDKILFPKQKIKKLDIIKYYIEIAELMLPYVKNRLLSVIRCHENIEKECFFKKHPTTEIEFLHTKKDPSAEVALLYHTSHVLSTIFWEISKSF